MHARAAVRELIEGLLSTFTPPVGFDPALSWRQDTRSAWWMDRPGFSPQAGAWGLRMPMQAPVGAEARQAVQLVTAEVLVPLMVSPTASRPAEDLLVDELVDELHAHLFASTEAGETLLHLSTSVTALADGWVLVTLRAQAPYLSE